MIAPSDQAQELGLLGLLYPKTGVGLELLTFGLKSKNEIVAIYFGRLPLK
jgi:hypothetical protein